MLSRVRARIVQVITVNHEPPKAGPLLGDVAKASLVLDAIPVNASWLKILTNSPRRHRIPESVRESVHNAWVSLSGERFHFSDEATEALYVQVVEDLERLNDALSGMFTTDQGYAEVPKEWERDMPEQYREVLDAIWVARDAFVVEYETLLNQLNTSNLITWATDA